MTRRSSPIGLARGRPQRPALPLDAFEQGARQMEEAAAILQRTVAAGRFPPERRADVVARMERIEKAAHDAAEAVRQVRRA